MRSCTARRFDRSDCRPSHHLSETIHHEEAPPRPAPVSRDRDVAHRPARARIARVPPVRGRRRAAAAQAAGLPGLRLGGDQRLVVSRRQEAWPRLSAAAGPRAPGKAQGRLLDRAGALAPAHGQRPLWQHVLADRSERVRPAGADLFQRGVGRSGGGEPARSRHAVRLALPRLRRRGERVGARARTVALLGLPRQAAGRPPQPRRSLSQAVRPRLDAAGAAAGAAPRAEEHSRRRPRKCLRARPPAGQGRPREAPRILRRHPRPRGETRPRYEVARGRAPAAAARGAQAGPRRSGGDPDDVRDPHARARDRQHAGDHVSAAGEHAGGEPRDQGGGSYDEPLPRPRGREAGGLGAARSGPE